MAAKVAKKKKKGRGPKTQGKTKIYDFALLIFFFYCGTIFFFFAE